MKQQESLYLGQKLYQHKAVLLTLPKERDRNIIVYREGELGRKVCECVSASGAASLLSLKNMCLEAYEADSAYPISCPKQISWVT